MIVNVLNFIEKELSKSTNKTQKIKEFSLADFNNHDNLIRDTIFFHARQGVLVMFNYDDKVEYFAISDPDDFRPLFKRLSPQLEKSFIYIA